MHPPPPMFSVRVANKGFMRAVHVRVANDRVKVACFDVVGWSFVGVADKVFTEGEGINRDWCGGIFEDRVAPGHSRMARTAVPSKLPL
jgi:hypothetical protein